MNKGNMRLFVIAAIAALSTCTAKVGSASTIATFADPTIGNPVVSMFTMQNTSAGIGSVTGGWTGTNLNLQMADATYSNATMSFSAIGYSGSFNSGTLGAGAFDFYDSSSNLVFKVSFDSAMLNIGGLAGDNIFSANNVQFSGMAVSPLGALSEESFAFSFTNQKLLKSAGQTIGFSATAAFTSSAVPLPEPAAMGIIALGTAALLRRRR